MAWEPVCRQCRINWLNSSQRARVWLCHSLFVCISITFASIVTIIPWLVLQSVVLCSPVAFWKGYWTYHTLAIRSLADIYHEVMWLQSSMASIMHQVSDSLFHSSARRVSVFFLQRWTLHTFCWRLSVLLTNNCACIFVVICLVDQISCMWLVCNNKAITMLIIQSKWCWVLMMLSLPPHA